MTTWYRTRWHDSTSADLKEVEVEKVTDSCVYVSGMHGRRSAKRSNFENFFETREEAVEFVRDGLRGQRDYYQRQADLLAEALAKFS